MIKKLKCTYALPPCIGDEFLTFIRLFLQMHYSAHLKLPATGCSKQWGSSFFSLKLTGFHTAVLWKLDFLL